MSMVPNFLVMVILRGMSGFFLASLRPKCSRDDYFSIVIILEYYFDYVYMLLHTYVSICTYNIFLREFMA